MWRSEVVIGDSTGGGVSVGGWFEFLVLSFKLGGGAFLAEAAIRDK